MCGSVKNMNTPSESTMTLDSQDLDQLLAANLPEDALQIAATTFSGVEDERLSAAAREASQHGTQMPLVREELRNRILLRRHHDGMPPIQPEFAPPKDYQLTPAEKAKKERRKEQNRRAARKCRLKRKNEENSAQEKCDFLRATHRKLSEDVTKLHEYLTALKSVLMTHLAVCTVLPPALPGHGQEKPEQQQQNDAPSEYVPVPESISELAIAAAPAGEDPEAAIWCPEGLGSALWPGLTTIIADQDDSSTLDTGPGSTDPLPFATLDPQPRESPPEGPSLMPDTQPTVLTSSQLFCALPNFLESSGELLPHAAARHVQQEALPDPAMMDLPGYPFCSVGKRKRTGDHQGPAPAKKSKAEGHPTCRTPTTSGRANTTALSARQSHRAPSVSPLSLPPNPSFPVYVGNGCRSAPPNPPCSSHISSSSNFFTFPNPSPCGPYLHSRAPGASLTPPPKSVSPYGAPTPSPVSPGGLRVVPDSGLPSPAMSILDERGHDEESLLNEQLGPMSSSLGFEDTCLSSSSFQELLETLASSQGSTLDISSLL